MIQFRQPRYLLQAALFFFIITVFFGFSMAAPTNILHAIVPGVIWVALLLAILLSCQYIFRQDYEAGVVEQWLVSGYSLLWPIQAKLLIHWLFILLPLLIFCALLAVLFNFSAYETLILICSLFIGSPALIYLAALAAASSDGKGLLMALILLPLSLPVMIFGSGALIASMHQNMVAPYLALLGAMSLLAISFLPAALVVIIRISLLD